MDSSMEIRKLSIGLKSELGSILELQESWKKLMAIIPKTLVQDDYKCDIGFNNVAKYRSEHFRLIENHALKTRKLCSETLLREWGSSGRVRPTLGHLKYLLEKAELYRAADFLTVDIMKLQPPQRPAKGPSARVVIKPEEFKDTATQNIEKMLDEINYPSSAIENINKMNSINTNLNYSMKEQVAVIPKIVVSESPNVEEPPVSFNVPLVMQNQKMKSASDLIEFSKDSVSDPDNVVAIPQLTLLNNSERSGDINSNANIPQLSSLLYESSESRASSSTVNSSLESNFNIPNIIAQNYNSEPTLNIPNIISQNYDSEPNLNIPNLSELNIESSTNLPAFSQLINNSESKTAPSKNSRSCSSPLPNLSLNTLLPHFTYSELEFATNSFDETPLTKSGRFLGSGAFGKVYLAVGLLSKPVAVKKLLLDNDQEVHVDDTVTKQFRNEVEVLSKYKHENLLSLLGYSCDGCTYCLLYEYIPGGALKDRLQKNELIWTERLYISIGTAKAISYLHTAYATPLIHRDVKSANILLDYTNKPKLCDFGLIKLSPSQNTSTGTTIFGTSAYMAPEAFRGDISIKLDTFSFGVVLLELLTSLSPVDETREGVDLFTHVDDKCEDDITPLLDVSVGPWKANNFNFADELYKIARLCLEEKKKRPTMSEINKQLVELVKKCL